jgi:hypothetical protein
MGFIAARRGKRRRQNPDGLTIAMLKKQRSPIFVRMKQVVAFGLMVALLLSAASKTVLIADYLLNYDYISKVLCINRDKPESCCNGKCHLMKEMSKQEESEEKTKVTVRIPETSSELFVVQYAIPFQTATRTEFAEAVYITLTGISEEIDHPPAQHNAVLWEQYV